MNEDLKPNTKYQIPSSICLLIVVVLFWGQSSLKAQESGRHKDQLIRYYFVDPDLAIQAGVAYYEQFSSQFKYLYFNELIIQSAQFRSDSKEFSNACKVTEGFFQYGGELKEICAPAYWWYQAILHRDSLLFLKEVSEHFLKSLLKHPKQLSYKTSRFSSSVLNLLMEYPELEQEYDQLLHSSTKYLKPICFDSLSYSYGKQFDINELRGRWFALDFWWLGCGSCRMEHPDLEKAHQELNKSQEIPIFLTIASDQPELIKEYMIEKQLTFPVWRSSLKNSMNWGIKVWPTKAIVFPNGKVLNISYSQQNWDEWLDFYTLRKVLNPNT